MLTLRPMTAEEYDHYADAMWEDYAHERARNLGTALEQERAVAAQQRAQLVPEGWRTPGQRFWCLLDESGARVGRQSRPALDLSRRGETAGVPLRYRG